MHASILQKAIDELNQSKPRLDYVRGMLETLKEIQTPAPTVPAPFVPILSGPTPTVTSKKGAIVVGPGVN